MWLGRKARDFVKFEEHAQTVEETPTTKVKNATASGSGKKDSASGSAKKKAAPKAAEDDQDEEVFVAPPSKKKAAPAAKWSSPISHISCLQRSLPTR
jgi:hypothetical protein